MFVVRFWLVPAAARRALARASSSAGANTKSRVSVICGTSFARVLTVRCVAFWPFSPMPHRTRWQGTRCYWQRRLVDVRASDTRRLAPCKAGSAEVGPVGSRLQAQQQMPVNEV